jgi:general secretion pathway protein H
VFSRDLKKRSRSGFTLLEIVVALAIVGLILGVVISQMDTMLDWDMKKASGKLASTIRYLYNKSATEGLYIRLMLDMEENAYWIEATTDQFTLSSGENEKKKKDKDKGDKKSDEEKQNKDQAAKEKEKPEGGKDEDTNKGTLLPGQIETLKPHEPVFSQVDDYLLKPTKLPDTVFFKDVYVEHEKGPVGSGKVAIHFFPNGYVEHSIINLRDENDKTNYSLETNPVNGRVSVEEQYRQMGKE